MADKEIIRSQQIELFQENLKKIRTIIGWSGANIAEMVGVSRQTVNNLEGKKTVMSAVQYLAFGAVVEQAKKYSPETRRIIDVLLSGFPRIENGLQKAEGINLIDEWFLSFPEFFNSITPNENALSSFELIEKITKDCKVIVCPDVFETDGVMSFLETVEMPLKENENKIILPASSLSKKSLPVEIADRVNQMIRENVVELKGEADDPSINELVLSLCTRFRSIYDLCIVTQDSLLALDVLALNGFRSQQGTPIVVTRLNAVGDLLKTEGFIEPYDEVPQEIEEEIIDLNVDDTILGSVSSEQKQESAEPKQENPIQGWGTL